MEYKVLYIFVEGLSDTKFVEGVIKPLFIETYSLINIIEYAPKKNEYINNLLKSIEGMKADYIWLADINSKPCVTSKIDAIKNKYKSANIDEKKIVVVKKEIESWYFAGLDKKSSDKLNVTNYTSTDDIYKEGFLNKLPDKYKVVIESKEQISIDFNVEMLKHFNIETAKSKNQSFKYFMEKFVE